MHLKITYQNQQVGFIEFTAIGYELKSVVDEAHRNALTNLLEYYYKFGIEGGVDNDQIRKEPIKADEQRFILELTMRLNKLGYALNQ